MYKNFGFHAVAGWLFWFICHKVKQFFEKKQILLKNFSNRIKTPSFLAF